MGRVDATAAVARAGERSEEATSHGGRGIREAEGCGENGTFDGFQSKVIDEFPKMSIRRHLQMLHKRQFDIIETRDGYNILTDFVDAGNGPLKLFNAKNGCQN